MSKSIALVVVCLFLTNCLVSGAVYSYSQSDRAALAPPSFIQPPCQVFFDHIIGDWGVKTYDLGEGNHVKWAHVDIAYLAGRLLQLSQDPKNTIHNPKKVLISLIKRHINNRNARNRVLRKGLGIDRIEQVREDGRIKTFVLPVLKRGLPIGRIIYSLQGAGKAVEFSDGVTVYVRVEIANSEGDNGGWACAASPKDLRPARGAAVDAAAEKRPASPIALLKEQVKQARLRLKTKIETMRDELSILGDLDRAAKVPWNELVRYVDIQKNPRSENEYRYWLNQIAVREKFIILLKDIADGNLSSTTDFSARLRDLNRVLLLGADAGNRYIPPTAYGDFKDRIEELAGRNEEGTTDEQFLVLAEEIFTLLNEFVSRINDARLRGARDPAKDTSPVIAEFFARFSRIEMDDTLKFLFHRGNYSLIMNMVNCMLRLSGLNGIEHGAVDEMYGERWTFEHRKEVFYENVTLSNPSSFDFSKVSAPYQKFGDWKGTSPGKKFSQLPNQVFKPTPESERIHAEDFQVEVDTIKAEQAIGETAPTLVALGTDWIKGYEEGQPQYNALNPLISKLKRCGIPFVEGRDEDLPEKIKALGLPANTRVVILANAERRNGKLPRPLSRLRKIANSTVVGVDGRHLRPGSYMPLMEMLTMALRLSRDEDYQPESKYIIIRRPDLKFPIYIFIPPERPVNTMQLPLIYKVQANA